ncbi:MAG: NAD(P)H-hydrate dehydratase [Ruminococcus sp.]|nr:NAD(P)H-hydrate dehydratase [Ruminococcus sp.]
MKYQIDKNIVKAAVKKRPADSDKTTVGTLLSICGSYGMAGAAIMSAKSALRSGIGLLKLAVPDEIYPIIAPSIPEAVFLPTKDIATLDIAEKSKYCGAVLAGCGFGICDSTRAIVKNMIDKLTVPMVFDADALNVIAENTGILRGAKAPIILTPHDREFSRLANLSVDEVKENREELALAFAKEHGVIIVLKGHITIVANPDGDVLYNDIVGNAGMSSGGSGDVLAGIIASLTAQGGNPFKCAAAGVYLHGLAGDIAKDKFGEISMLPTDIIDCLSESFKRCGLN